MTKPAVPALFVIPGTGHLDFPAVYAIATAYAHAGHFVSAYGDRHKQIQFSFPAVVCSSFSLELFLKFFLMLDRANRGITERKFAFGHEVPDLWKKVCQEHKALIAGSFRNNSGVPHTSASERRIELFEEALEGLGTAPFKKWRYVHELEDLEFMSHAAISEVVDAFGYAAEFLMKEHRARAAAFVGPLRPPDSVFFGKARPVGVRKGARSDVDRRVDRD